jgi:uncharacterized membrane protein
MDKPHRLRAVRIGAIKLWRRDGTLITTLSGHTDVVMSVASAQMDKPMPQAVPITPSNNGI